MNAADTGTTLVQILTASALLESVWETISLVIDKREKSNLATRIGTIVIGLFLAFSYNIDVLAYLGLKDHIPYSGVFLTGILISRGSNFVHDLLTRLGTWRQTLAVLTPVSNPGVISSASSLKVTPVVTNPTDLPPTSTVPPTTTTTVTTTTPAVPPKENDNGKV